MALKNSKLSEEQKMKISNSLKNYYKTHKSNLIGTHLSPSTEFKKGYKPHNTGKKWSKDVREKISKSSMGKIVSEKTRKKLRDIALRGDDNPSKRPEVREKISKNNLGKKLSDEAKKKISKTRIKRRVAQGENNPNWQGGKSFEPYDKSFNNQFKRIIRKRDNQVCMLCGVHREKLNETLSIHHINYDKLMSVPQNCISLCRDCHLKTNFNRKHWAKFFQDLLSEKYGYQYKDGEIVMEIKKTGTATIIV